MPPSISTSNPPQQTADTIVALIEAEEGKYQASLNNSYQEMSEKTFKSLRRALPMTRQKLDWDRVSFFSFCNGICPVSPRLCEQVLGYKLGAELTSSRNAFGAS